MNARQTDLLHPRLTVVPVVGRPDPVIEPAPGRTVIGSAELAQALATAAERRRAELRDLIAQLDQQLAAATSDAGAAEATAEQRREEHDALLAAARWCESLPEHLEELRSARAEAEAVLFERLRASRAAGRALERVLEQRSAAAAVVAEARGQMAVLHAPVGGASETGHLPEQLTARTEALEGHLAVAEAEAHLGIEHAAGAVFEAERALAELAERRHDRLSQLAGLAEGLPAEERPPPGDDALDHLDGVVAHLRSLAETFADQVADADAAVVRSRSERDDLAERIEGVRDSVDQSAAEDAVEALAAVASDADADVVVLDGVVATEADEAGVGLLGALEAVDGLPPLVLVSADPTVLGWAIDLPGEVGAVAAPAVLDLLEGEGS